MGGEDAVEPLGGERFEDAVVEESGDVHDGGQRTARGDRVEGGGEGGAVGGVAGGEGDLGAQVPYGVGEFGGAGRVGAAAAGEQQVPGAVGGDEVLGEQPAKGAGGAGDEHGALRVQGSRDGQHELAGVLGLAEVAQRVGGPGGCPRR
ncbi:hypothetical protein GCM10020000_52820 [Streptomyces olivoverticillatus]